MKNHKILLAIITGLVLLNILLVGFMWTHHKGMKKHKPTDTRIQNAFNFSDEQMAQFKVAKNKHQSTIKSVLKELAKKSDTYYDLSSNENKDKLLDEITLLDKQVYELNMQHFKDIEAICNPDQLQYLDKFVKRLIQRGKGNPDQKRKGPR